MNDLKNNSSKVAASAVLTDTAEMIRTYNRNSNWIAYFFFMNFYAILFDLITTMIIAALFILPLTGWLITILSIAALISSILGINIHIGYFTRRRIYNALLFKNRKKFIEKTFYDYMDIACFRMVCRGVLKKLNDPVPFSKLKNDYRQYCIDNRVGCRHIIYYENLKLLYEQKGENHGKSAAE